MDDVFDLKEFIITILRKWKMMLILALICCVLGGAFKLIPALVGGSGDAKIQNTVQKNYQQSLNAYKMQKTSLESQIEGIKSKQAEVAQYNTNSILMKINPYNVNIAGVDICVNTNYKIIPGMTYQTPDYAAQLVSAYSLLAQNGSMYEAMVKDLNLNTEQRYLREIISVSDDLDNNILSIHVFSPDLQMSEHIRNYIYQYIVKSEKQLTDTIGEHSLQIINNSSYVSVDMEIYKTQITYLTQSADLTKSLSEKKDELKNLTEPDEISVATETGADIQPTIGSSIKSIFKFMLLGFFGGILLGVLFAFFLDVFDNSIQNDYEINRKFGLRYIGTISEKKKRGAN